jgi:hypothetical protein
MHQACDFASCVNFKSKKKLFPHCEPSHANVPREDRSFRNQSDVMPGIHKSFKIRAQALSSFTHTYVLRRTLVAKAEMY